MIQRFTRQPAFRLLWSGQFLAIAGLMVMVPLLPIYMKELGATDAASNGLWTGLSLAAPAVTSALCSPLWGRYGDRLGRKWMVVRALLGLGLCLLLMGMAQTPLQFFLARLLQGACGGVVDAASAYAGGEAPEGERGRALGSLQSATAAGSLVGPLAGGVLADWVGFGWLLTMMGALTFGSGVLTSFILRETKQPSTATSRTSCPKVRHVFSELLTHPRLRRFLFAGLCAQIGIYGSVAVFAPHVERLLPNTLYLATWVGMLQALAWAAGTFGGIWWGRRNDQRPVESNLSWALLFCGVSIILQAIPTSAELLIPLRIVQGFCFSALLQSVFLAVTQESRSGNNGVRIGATNSFLTLGQIIGSLGGAMLGTLLTTSTVFAIMGALFVIGAGWLGQIRWLPAAYRVDTK